MKNRLLLLFIISIFIIIFIIFYKGLKNTNVYTPDIKINKEVPSFTAELFYSKEVIKSKEIFDLDKFYLLNIWSSWCVPCRQEHSSLMNLMKIKKIKIIGLNYKDTKKNAKSFLSELGNPFHQIIFDKEGINAIEWGAYGVPESFLIYDRKIIKKYIGSFTLSMCGTFLVRSGILNSVHTFANDPERGLFILIFLFSLIFISLFIFFFFHKPNQSNLNNFFWLSKETSIIINNWFMMYFLSVVLVGTVYPIFLDVLTSEKISVGPPFYHKLIIPFLIPFLLIMAIGPKLKWIKSNLEDKVYLISLLFISFLLSFLIVKNFNSNFLINTILISSALYLFFVTLRDFFIKKKNNISQNIAHFGFSLLILSILFNSLFSTEIITNLKVGETFETSTTKIIFKNINQKKEKNYKSVVGNFSIQNSNGKMDNLSPELRIYNQPNIVTSEADIKTTLLSDKFLVINLVQNQDYFNVRYQVKPFMLWIWLSVLLISSGALISLFKKEYEK